jgi:hypothetical protein
VGDSLPSPKDGNTSSFQNVVFSNYLEFRTIDKVHKPNYSRYYTPSSEHFMIYIPFSRISVSGCEGKSDDDDLHRPKGMCPTAIKYV